MRRQIWAIGLSLAVLACSGHAFAQAAAEAALTHGVAAGASTGLGSAFGKMENQLAGRLGQQVSTTTPRQTVTVIRPGAQKSARTAHVTAPTTSAPPANGSLIAYIQGAEQPVPTCAPLATADPKAASAPAAQKPGDCAAPPSHDANQYQSVITLPAPK